MGKNYVKLLWKKSRADSKQPDIGPCLKTVIFLFVYPNRSLFPLVFTIVAFEQSGNKHFSFSTFLSSTRINILGSKGR